eukprot:TRINITY_DN845_c1_g1_i3.p1 TRINITY_DN845_c1_g1~~TRINITY_DN845_c1_g1_i3.p1  ORF type:complete len:235 (-),score=-1.67 TRINITY_DN845_c1_g1_i3:519-1223(-)
MCTLEKHGRIFLLTLTGADQHRLNPTLIDSIRAALSRVRAEQTPGSALVTTAEGNFFSNGFDLNWAKSEGPTSYPDRRRQVLSGFEKIVADMISLPIPTVAAVSGHAAAAGFMFVLSHDYVLMRKDRGFLYMSEMDIGLVIPDTVMALIRSKIVGPRDLRHVVMRAAKITAVEAVERGIIDSAHDSVGETVVAAMRLGEELAGKGWDGELYAAIRKAAYPEYFRVFGPKIGARL